MRKENFRIGNIPAILYGDNSDKLYIFVHGKFGNKEEAEGFAALAIENGYQVISFDLPEHGERKNENYECTIQNGVSDLREVYSFVQDKYSSFSLFAGSLGAYFSLLAYQNVKFEKCLFVSPVLDMERLIQNMMKEANVTEDELRMKGTIKTTDNVLSWNYYDFICKNPIKKWNKETYILYGENDNITEKSVLHDFVKKFNCNLEIIQNGEHWFHTEEQVNYLDCWLRKHINRN